MSKANLLVTFDPTHVESAKKEIEEKLSEVKEKGKLLKAEDGLAQISVKDAKKAVKALSKLKKFAITNRWIPVDKWTNAKIPDMQKCIKTLSKEISAKDKWKLDLGKHQGAVDIPQRDLIVKLTEVIENPNVDLEKPTKIVRVDIIGKTAAISILNKDEIFNAADKR